MAFKQNEPQSGVVTGPPNGAVQGYRRGLDSGTPVDPVGREPLSGGESSDSRGSAAAAARGTNTGEVHTDAARGTPSAMAGAYRDSMDHPKDTQPAHAGFSTPLRSEQDEEVSGESREAGRSGARANLPVPVYQPVVRRSSWSSYLLGTPGMIAATAMVLTGVFMLWRNSPQDVLLIEERRDVIVR